MFLKSFIPIDAIHYTQSCFSQQEKLIVAIQEGSFRKAKLCLQRGANVNYVNEVNVETNSEETRDGIKYVRKVIHTP